MKNFNFKFYGDVRFGTGCRFATNKIIDSDSLNKIVVVIDKNVRNNNAVLALLTGINNFIEKEIIFSVSEPTYEILEEERFDSNSHKIDGIIAIGGGSTIDLAKGLSVLYNNNGKATLYRGYNKFDLPILPIIAIPTTAGTGSEITPNASFIDTLERRKMGINGEALRPKYAMLDPELTLSCPKTATISAGIDSMVHATEAFVAKDTNLMAKMFSIEGFSLVFENLPLLVNDLENITLRENVMYGAFLSAIALMNSGTGPAAAMSYPLGVHFGVPHGIGGGIFLPYIIQHNIDAGFFDYAELYQTKKNINSEKSQAKLFIKKIWATWQRLGVPDNLGEFGLVESDVALFISDTMHLKAALDQNPIPFYEKEINETLEKLLVV